MKKTMFAIFFYTGCMLFPSCKKELSCEGCIASNKPPIAAAGQDQITILPKDSVLLDGSASSAPNGTINSYKWTKVSGPASAIINHPDSSRTMARQLTTGNYLFELKITDNRGSVGRDTIKITVATSSGNNLRPIANAGPDQTVISAVSACTLDGRGSYDPDGTIDFYEWTQIGGPPVKQLAFPTAVQAFAHFDVVGQYQFELTVTDNGGLSATDTVNVIVSAVASPSCDNANRPQVNAQLIAVGTLSEPRVGVSVAASGNKVLFAGAALSSSGANGYGSSRVDIYDVSTKTWSQAQLSKLRSDIAAVACGNKIFFAGGRLGDGAFDQLFSTVDIYDVSNNTWSTASLSEPRAYVSAATVGNKVFFAGGEKNWNYDCSDKVDIYDVSTNTWSTAQLSVPRSGISAVTVNNKIYFAGGSSENRWYTPSNRIDIYDNNTNSWSTSSLNEPMAFLSGVTVLDKILWASHCKVEIKDVNTWNSSISNLFKPAGYPGANWYGGWTIVEGQNAVVKDSKVVFFRHRQMDTNKFDIYDVTNNTWSIGVLQQNVSAASIISVNNTIYLTDGTQVWRLEF